MLARLLAAKPLTLSGAAMTGEKGKSEEVKKGAAMGARTGRALSMARFTVAAVWLAWSGLGSAALVASTAANAVAAVANAPDVTNPASVATAARAARAAPVARPVRWLDLPPPRKPSEVVELAGWVRITGDNQRLPFVIIDKKRARVYVFGPQGQLRGWTPALLGLARGDHSVPGIGERPMASIRPEERTTPAGRFAAEVGRNFQGEDIVWVDYDAAVSLHRVRTHNPAERRLERLASPVVSEHRISYGCINVPHAFFDNVVSPAFAVRGRGIVYILPETQTLSAVFGGLKAASYLP